jgi:hypothetical protein
MGGVAPATDGGVDVPPDSGPDSGPSCNPDAGGGNPDAEAGAWHFFGAPLSVSPSGSYLPALALLPDGRPVVAWTDGQPQSVIHQFAPFDQSARTYTVVWNPCDGTWQAMGQPVAGMLPALLVSPGSNQLFRAWVSNDNPSVLTVERWNGTAFEALGAPFQTVNQSIISPVLVADANGNPILGWLDGLNSSTVQVAQWNGSAWQMLSPAGGVPGDLADTFFGTARALSLAISPTTGLVAVAWAGTKIVTNVASRLLSGTAWTTPVMAPNTFNIPNSVNGPVVGVNAAGEIFLATIATDTSNGDDSDAVSVWSLNATGTTWQLLGGPLVSGTYARDYDMIIDSSGAPIVVDSELVGVGGDLVFTYRWNGSSWQAPAPGVNAPPLAEAYGYNPTIALDGSGRLVAAWVYFDDSSSPTTAIAVARYQP